MAIACSCASPRSANTRLRAGLRAPASSATKASWSRRLWSTGRRRRLCAIPTIRRGIGSSRRCCGGSPAPIPRRCSSLTKFSALAGLRVGLAFAQPRVVDALRKVKPPWNVNAVAQAAGEYALRHPELLPDLAWLHAARDELMQGLRRLGLAPLPTDCNFFLVPIGDAAGIRRKLLGCGCLVRDCASFGLPDHIRIAARSPEDNAKLLAAFEEVL